MRCLLESDVHRAKEDLVIKVLGTLHEGSIPFEPADDQVAGWIRLAVSLMRLYPNVPPEPYGQHDTVVFHALCVIEVLAGRAFCAARDRRRAHFFDVDAVVPEAVQVIVELALETLSYDSGPFCPELSMVAFAVRPIAILERSDELCELALKALCSLALTDGAAVVAADAVRIAMHVLSHPHLPQAWEWAVCLLSILASDGHGVHETTRATRRFAGRVI
ncbi:hypothetical protein EMIHUDRAFT_230166 [Emiliania huxleyi CCMP1516]|uniref:Uncharacterized protein n=2 Tax=Emiliania huxleyi TaxID=2903 RepID=A0A0D3KB49_EMIH1|nr:hypothetical protein EMIHUDRAFT_220482 [Emiliania huxleyi CCMP1516]XP_005785413.1 hypothetical protein EMIHUDRAFT_230166 [Emiliania huxleyi CCMP1516]EOD05004.1 hypothetical protein EMIHUDRAFT_220482 [Emiliania huxleyi CCMP1516]EOD32984.1 hypothetical protein EMIHUDRAFT_230166 [Emiliania huxleyi CCMP1516]|eukprot:XP_005757433.1 hypothetical protein EMIHUDRAFT_220482 [Emiliania huxleyi CCMP1516]